MDEKDEEEGTSVYVVDYIHCVSILRSTLLYFLARGIIAATISRTRQRQVEKIFTTYVRAIPYLFVGLLRMFRRTRNEWKFNVGLAA